MAGMLGQMSHAELAALRDRPGAPQGMLAPFEHRAFAREWTKENPLVAGASLPFAIPAYSAAKALGLVDARSPASMDEVFAGYHGYAEGMLDNLVPSAHAAGSRPAGDVEFEVSEDPAGHSYSREELARLYRGSPQDYRKAIAIEQFYKRRAAEEAARERAAEREAMMQRTREMWDRMKQSAGGMLDYLMPKGPASTTYRSGVNGAMPEERPEPPKRTPSVGVRG